MLVFTKVYRYGYHDNYCVCQILLSTCDVHFINFIGLTFDLDSDKESAHRDDGATLTCMASIRFPPFSMILFIKDGETVATSTSGQLQIDTKSVNANPFGLYICQLNASGVTFNRTIFIKERGNYIVAIYTTRNELASLAHSF